MRALLMMTALALAVLGQVSALVHWGVVKHTTCAEHGDIIDDDGGHCVIGLTPGEAIDAPPLSVAHVDVVTPIDAPRTAFALVIERDVLFVAPKTSPPV